MYMYMRMHICESASANSRRRTDKRLDVTRITIIDYEARITNVLRMCVCMYTCVHVCIYREKERDVHTTYMHLDVVCNERSTVNIIPGTAVKEDVLSICSQPDGLSRHYM